MKNHFETIKGKRLTSLITLTLLILYTAALSINPFLENKPFSATGIAYTDDGDKTTSSFPISLIKANEALNYLKKLDSNQGIADFQDYFNKKLQEKNRLIEIRDDLASEIAKLYRSQDQELSLITPDFPGAETFHNVTPENATLSDLITRIDNEIKYEQLILRLIQSLNNVSNALKENEAINQIETLEKKFIYENDLIKYLKESGDNAYAQLISELILENKITEFWTSYATAGQAMINRLKSYLSEDIVFLNDKLEKEQSISSYLKELYPTDEDKKAPLDDFEITLLNLYQKENTEQTIIKYANILLQSETILSYINDSRLMISPDLPTQIKLLSDLRQQIESGSMITDTFRLIANQLYEMLAIKNQTNLGEDNFYNNQFEVLKAFNAVLSLTDIASYEEDLNALKEIYPSAMDYERILSKKAEAKIEEAIENVPQTPVEAPIGAQVEEPIDTTVGETMGGTIGGTIGETIDTNSTPDGNPIVPPIVTPSEEQLKEAATIEEIQPTETPTEPATETPVIPQAEVPIVVQPEVPEVTPEAETPAIPQPETPVTPEAETPAVPAPEATTAPTAEEQLIQQQIPQPSEEISSTEASQIISIFEGNDKALEESMLIEQIIKEDPNIIYLDSAISDLEKFEKYALMTQDIVNNIDTQTIDLDSFITVLDNLNFSPDEFDEFLNFLSQVARDFGYIGAVSEFSGINGVIRFNSDECPEIALWQSIDPADQSESFAALPLEKQGAIILDERKNESDPNYARLKSFRKLNVDFCILESTDITTKNLVGLPEFNKLATDTYKVDLDGIGIDFLNNKTRDANIYLGRNDSYGDVTDEKSFILRHGVEEGAYEDELKSTVESAVKEKMGSNIVVEDIQISPDTAQSAQNEKVFSMSALENPDHLFTPLGMDHKETYKNIIVYESQNHRKNYIEIFSDDAHSVNHRRMSDYTIFNYGTGAEEDLMMFDNAVLHVNDRGVIEGYILPIVNPIEGPIVNPIEAPMGAPTGSSIEDIYRNGLPSGPDFVIKTPYVLDRNNNLVDGFNFEITGENHNHIYYKFNTAKNSYPLVLKAEVVFTSQGQPNYDSLIDSSTGTNTRFGSAQTIGDFNSDGVNDIAVGAYSSNGYAGSVSVYLGSKDSPYYRNTPDALIKGDSLNYLGYSLAADDFDGDGISDLVIGSPLYNKNQGRVWIFNGKNIMNQLSGNQSVALTEISLESADLTIDGAGASDGFGATLLTGDFDTDGKEDLVVSSPSDRDGRGLVQIFGNLTLLPNENGEKKTLASTSSDIAISGESGEALNFGKSLAAGDFDNDSKTDLAISATGKAYLFFQNESPFTNGDTVCQKNCKAENADSAFEGGDDFGYSVASGDFNADNRDDLAVGAPDFDLSGDTNEGRVYLFYQDDIPWTNQDLACTLCNAANADGIITGNAGDYFGSSLATPDFNDDGKIDLAVGAYRHSARKGMVYVFYDNPQSDKPNIASGGSMGASDHDIAWEGESLSDFGFSLTAGDLNSDSVSDISIGAPYYYNFSGRLYTFYGKPVVTAPVSTGEGYPQVTEEEQKPIEGPIEGPAEEQKKEGLPGFELTPEKIEENLKEAAEETQGFLLDISPPGLPVISCEGLISGVASTLDSTVCTWTDTAGPSQGTYKYCIDNDNSCVPDIVSQERSVQVINLSEHHNYLRVQTSDEGGASETASFDFSINHTPALTVGPSDGGSDAEHPVDEGDSVNFTATANDIENDPYYLAICRTSDMPVYINGQYRCSGLTENNYCVSDLTPSDKEAKCSFETEENAYLSELWYAFICESPDVSENCNGPYQGSGPDGSPFYIKHPARYSDVIVTDKDGATIEPGDLLKFTLPSKNITGVSKDNNVTMFVCDANTEGFDYVNNQCIKGNLICASAPTDPKAKDVVCEERKSDNQIVPIPTPAGEKHVNVFVKKGEKGIVEGVPTVQYNVTNVKPSIVDYTNEGDILIPGGGSADISFSALLEDLNGNDDIYKAEGIFFDSDSVWNTCAGSKNDCYKDSDCKLTKIDATKVKAVCNVTLFYNANASKYWKVHVNPIDPEGLYTDLGDSTNNRIVPPLYAINQEELAIPYQLAQPGETTPAVETMLTNLGNQVVDVLISGTDLTGKQNVLPKELQKWSLEPDFDYDKEGYPLVENAIESGGPDVGCANVNLPVHEDTGTSQNVMIYWRIKIPENQKADNYTGTVSFTPTSDTCESGLADGTSVQSILNR